MGRIDQKELCNKHSPRISREESIKDGGMGASVDTGRIKHLRRERWDRRVVDGGPGHGGGEGGHVQSRIKGALPPKGMLTPDRLGGQKWTQVLKGISALGSTALGTTTGQDSVCLCTGWVNCGMWGWGGSGSAGFPTQHSAGCFRDGSQDARILPEKMRRKEGRERETEK